MTESELIEYNELRKRYSEILLGILDETISNISLTRKGSKIAERKVIREFAYWDKFPISKVVGACVVYNQKKLHDRGLSENYLRGIIRNMNEYELKTLRLFTEEELQERINRLYYNIVHECIMCGGGGFIYKTDNSLIDNYSHRSLSGILSMKTYECECLKKFNKKRDELISFNRQWFDKLGEI